MSSRTSSPFAPSFFLPAPPAPPTPDEARRLKVRGALMLATLLVQILAVAGAMYVVGALALMDDRWADLWQT